MQPITIHVRDDQGIDRLQEPIRLGVPLPRGDLRDTRALVLEDGTESLPLQIDIQSHWPDGSISWLLVQSLVSLAPHQGRELTLRESPTQVPDKNGTADDWLSASDGGWTLYTDDTVHFLDSHTGQLQSRALSSFSEIDPDNKHAASLADHPWDLSFHLHTDPTVPALHECIEKIYWSGSVGFVSARVIMEGHWFDQRQQSYLRFERSLTFYRHNGLVEVTECLHNPRRALHPGGLWDLGDPGSAYLMEYQARVSHPDIRAGRLQAEADTEIHTLPQDQLTASVYQDSSGGKHWHSRNHIDAHGQVTTRFSGYQLRRDKSSDISGTRALPIGEITTSDGPCSLTMAQFWQHFPKCLFTSDSGLGLGLFPRESGQRYELQGGERKTHRFVIGYNQALEQLRWATVPLCPAVAAHAYQAAEVFDWFYPTPASDKQATDSITQLLDKHLNAPQSLLEKREAIDEYGWRNFGDLYADHETRYQTPDPEPLVSHYNNQYDAILGFARQFALTGDSRWFDLMNDLARHVTDIDIYHTDEDRSEYNHGLFWHTDHYLPAQTATHRTFSRLNKTSSTPGQTGGGPADEHCYTTGLMLHYRITGDRASRQAVLDLADWMIRLHEGAPGLLSQLLAFRKREWRQIKQKLEHSNQGQSTYPLTRGTGNYLLALIDAHRLSGETHYLKRAVQVVHQTCHPNDDVDQRNLLDVENHWSYLVYLSSLVSFNQYLMRLQDPTWDAESNYSRATIITYTRWMLHHEEPFLSRQEHLEYANETWIAQDLRKVMLWYMASVLDPVHREAYLYRAGEWQQQIVQSLTESPYRSFTRIQVIILQLYGPQALADQPAPAEPLALMEPGDLLFGPQSTVSYYRLVGRSLRRLLTGVYQFRPARERAWIKARSNRP